MDIASALDFLKRNISWTEDLARRHAEALLADHRRVREAARDFGSYTVKPCLPVDLIGVYILLPESL
ncbi:MAG: hypothetical protein HQM10_16615 [Candidatus Riflebacteria bacterium]|nr:hypothetical protein [Candidatus Riflebacteria bacterium]